MRRHRIEYARRKKLERFEVARVLNTDESEVDKLCAADSSFPRPFVGDFGRPHWWRDEIENWLGTKWLRNHRFVG